MGLHLQAHEQISKQKKRLSRPVFVPFKREKFQRSLNHILLFFYRCRMLLYTLKFPLNRTELRVFLHGWFRATPPSSAPVCSPRPICCLWGVPLTNKLCVLLQVCPWWQIIHYSWMTELVLFVCLSPTTKTPPGKFVPRPRRGCCAGDPMDYHDLLALPGSHSLLRWSRLSHWEGPECLGNAL